MAPALRSGDIVLAVRDDDVPVGGIITARNVSGVAGTTTHRVVEVTADGYITQGDANSTPDPQPVPAEAVVGEARVVVPLIGWPTAWLRGGR